MYRNHGPRNHLLSTFRDGDQKKLEDIEDEISDSQEQGRSRREPKRLKVSEAVLDETDDESDGRSVQNDIKPTTFERASKSSERSTKRSTRASRSADSSSKKKKERDESVPRVKRRKVRSEEDEKENVQEDQPEADIPRRPKLQMSQESSDAPVRMTKSESSQPIFQTLHHKSNGRTYGKNTGKNRVSEKKASTKKTTKKGATFQALPLDDDTESPKKADNFKSIDGELSNTEATPKKAFSRLESEPLSDTPKASQSSQLLQSSQTSQSSRVTPSSSQQFSNKFKKLGKPKKELRIQAQKERERREDEEELRSRPKFMTFDTQEPDLAPLNDEDITFSEDEDLSVTKFEQPDGSQTPDDDKDTSPPVALCPWCNKEVDEALLSKFSKGKRLAVREQERFCRAHNKDSAAKLYKSRKYPEIKWNKLARRMDKYDSDLLAIVDGGDSYYRAKLAEKIEAGTARSLAAEENLNPGYYGPRGFNLMCDRLVARFSDMLKERALQDRVISGRGSAAFIQSVLVAELATRLIMDDMEKSYDKARVIMEDSKLIGELVNEEA